MEHKETINTLQKEKKYRKTPSEISIFREFIYRIVISFGTQLENANTIWWDNRKNAGVLLILWREKMKCELQIRNNWEENSVI